MRKRLITAAATALMTISMVVGSAMPAYANYDPVEAGEGEDPVKVEETITQPEDTTAPEEGGGALTPEGNMNLVDDVDGKEAGLQYMTVTTRDGSYFYIIIDRSAKEENVYFLNQVDAADLMKLMSDDEKAALEESQKEPETQAPVVTPTPTETPDETPQVEPEKPAKQNPLASSLPMLGILGGLGAIAAGGYYVLKVKPKKNQPDIDEDREFYDDDEYENEDVVEETEEEN